MPVLAIAVVFFLIFVVMGVVAVSAMIAEHKSRGAKLFSGTWGDLPKTTKIAAK